MLGSITFKGHSELAFFAAIILIADSTIPIVDFYLPFYVNAFLLCLVFFDIYRKKLFTKNFLLIVFLIALLVTLKLLFVYPERLSVEQFLNNYILWTPCFLTQQIKYYDKEFSKRLLWILCICLLITSVTTIIGLSMYPFAARELASGVNESGASISEKYAKLNIGGYGTIYTLVIMMPICARLINQKDIKIKVMSIILTVMFLYCIYSSQYTIALVISSIGLIITFVNFDFRKHYILLIVIVTVLISLRHFFAQIVLFIIGFIKFDYLADRLLQLYQFLEGIEVHSNTSTERIDLYKYDLECIKKSPILGNIFDHEPASGHTLILDVITTTGIIGLIIMLIIISLLISKCVCKISRIKSNNLIYMLLIFFAVACLNPISQKSIIMSVFIVLSAFTRIDRDTQLETNL